MFGTPRLAHRASPVVLAQRRRVRLWTESRDEFRGLLRKLLREASYLPDTTARSYFHARITSGFRAYQPPQGSSSPGERPVKRNWNVTKLLRQPGKLEKLRIQAHQTLSLLARANAGQFEAVDQMLNLAYGRAGPLRQQLLQPHLLPDEPKDDAALRASITKRASHKGEKKPSTAKKPPAIHIGLPSALVALVKAQIIHRGQIQGRDQIRHLYQTIPNENMWGRPMPLRRVRNLKRKLYLSLTQKVLPPLPRTQWERLKRLSSGEERWEGRSRRIPASRMLDIVASNSKSFWETSPVVMKRNVNQQFMQHRYRSLFAQTPCITSRSNDRKWRVEFGTTNSPRIPFATSDTLELFGIATATKEVSTEAKAGSTAKHQAGST